METKIEKQFAAIGARVEVTSIRARDRRIGRQWMTRRMSSTPMLVDVDRQSREEFFTVTHHSDADVNVTDVSPRLQHLVLTTRAKRESVHRTFLCGRDESHWFVAAIPERTEVCSVQQALDALKPREVWESIRLHDISREQWNLRRTVAFVRQGEWFFIPRPDVIEGGRTVRREPLSRGVGSQMHWCQQVLRLGGETVWVSARFPRGLTDDQYFKLPADVRKSQSWRRMARSGQAYARGWVRHPDHATIVLGGWHEIVMNTESQASAMRHVVFLD